MSGDDHNQAGPDPDCADSRPHGWHILTGGKPTNDKVCRGRGCGHPNHGATDHDCAPFRGVAPR